MRKSNICNVVTLIVFILLPFYIAYNLGNAELTWKNRDMIRAIANYSSVIIPTIASTYLIISNIKTFRQKNAGTAFLIACGLFLVLGLAAVVYSLFMLIVLLAFRNGINFWVRRTLLIPTSPPWHWQNLRFRVILTLDNCVYRSFTIVLSPLFFRRGNQYIYVRGKKIHAKYEIVRKYEIVLRGVVIWWLLLIECGWERTM